MCCLLLPPHPLSLPSILALPQHRHHYAWRCCFALLCMVPKLKPGFTKRIKGFLCFSQPLLHLFGCARNHWQAFNLPCFPASTAWILILSWETCHAEQGVLCFFQSGFSAVTLIIHFFCIFLCLVCFIWGTINETHNGMWFVVRIKPLHLETVFLFSFYVLLAKTIGHLSLFWRDVMVPKALPVEHPRASDR